MDIKSWLHCPFRSIKFYLTSLIIKAAVKRELSATKYQKYYYYIIPSHNADFHYTTFN